MGHRRPHGRNNQQLPVERCTSIVKYAHPHHLQPIYTTFQNRQFSSNLASFSPSFLLSPEGNPPYERPI